MERERGAAAVGRRGEHTISEDWLTWRAAPEEQELLIAKREHTAHCAYGLYLDDNACTVDPARRHRRPQPEERIHLEYVPVRARQWRQGGEEERAEGQCAPLRRKADRQAAGAGAAGVEGALGSI